MSDFTNTTPDADTLAQARKRCAVASELVERVSPYRGEIIAEFMPRQYDAAQIATVADFDDVYGALGRAVFRAERRATDALDEVHHLAAVVVYLLEQLHPGKVAPALDAFDDSWGLVATWGEADET